MIYMIGMTIESKLIAKTSVTKSDISSCNWVWIDLGNPTQTEIDHITHLFELQPIQDTRIGRPKMENYQTYNFYVTHLLEEEDNEIIKHELDLFVGDHFIITIHEKQMQITEDMRHQIHSQTHTKQWSTNIIFYQLLTSVIDNYYPLVEAIEDALETIEDNPDNKKMNTLMLELFDIRRMLLHISYTVTPMKDMVHQIMEEKHKRKQFTRLYDHLLKLSEIVMTNREITADIRDNYLSLNSYRTNNLMTVLTIVASIFTPLTFIAGVYGMNFTNMPELQWANGYYIVLLFMLFIALTMFFWFKRKGWFK